MNLIYLMVMLGMLITYPAYFYMLHEFKTRLCQDHPEIWRNRAQGHYSASLQIAYKALRGVQNGRLDGVLLSDRVAASHQIATSFLYSGMLCFLVLVLLGLYDSIWGAGKL
jgi:hypothetical protein